ncbi:MAG: hypothetical protein HY832_03380, partial [Candidatus Aenigmarchaeota archaeon]|nr:hypothetical protein [Candidatus Aenigmarchaeota archaeon]
MNTRLHIGTVLLLLALPAFAGGNITINATNLVGSYVNLDTTTDFLNLSLNVTPNTGNGLVNITSINVTINGSVTIGNISGIVIKNATGSIIASNNTNATNSTFT